MTDRMMPGASIEALTTVLSDSWPVINPHHRKTHLAAAREALGRGLVVMDGSGMRRLTQKRLDQMEKDDRWGAPLVLARTQQGAPNGQT